MHATWSLTRWCEVNWPIQMIKVPRTTARDASQRGLQAITTSSAAKAAAGEIPGQMAVVHAMVVPPLLSPLPLYSSRITPFQSQSPSVSHSSQNTLHSIPQICEYSLLSARSYLRKPISELNNLVLFRIAIDDLLVYGLPERRAACPARERDRK